MTCKSKEPTDIPPLCSCGCGASVKLGQRGKWNKFIKGHNGHEKKIYWDKFDEPPICRCGCGLKVGWSENWKRWKSFVNGHSLSKKVNPNKFKEPPLCGCGCGERVKWSQYNREWNNYLVGHNGTGVPVSEEMKKRISEKEKGKFVSEETRVKISKSKKGSKLSEKTREAMRNKIVSEEAKQKIRDHWVRLKNSDRYEGYIKSIFRRRGITSLEKKFQGIIDKYDLPFKFVGDGNFFIGKKNPDFIGTNEDKIAIEVYARFYKKRNFGDIDKWKRERGDLFLNNGFKSLFFDETEVKDSIVLERIGALNG